MRAIAFVLVVVLLPYAKLSAQEKANATLDVTAHLPLPACWPMEDSTWVWSGTEWRIGNVKDEEARNCIDRLTKHLRDNPYDSLAYKIRGAAWGTRNKWEIAIKDYDESLRLNPVQADVYALRGIARYNLGRTVPTLTKSEKDKTYDTARFDLESAIYIDPKCSAAYFYRGQSYLALGKVRLAVDDFDETLRLCPKAESLIGTAQSAETSGTTGMKADVNMTANITINITVTIKSDDGKQTPTTPKKANPSPTPAKTAAPPIVINFNFNFNSNNSVTSPPVKNDPKKK